MYKVISQELVGHGEDKRFLDEANNCKFCSTSDPASFGKKTNAHTFPEGLGNKTLFSLSECKACNSKFSQYEDALCKAVGPYLTLGGTKGKNGVRQTGRSSGGSVVKHSRKDGKRHIHIKANSLGDFSSLITANNEIINLRIPIVGDKFVPRYAYKALLKIALSLLPVKELYLFRRNLECLQDIDDVPGEYPLQVDFSYASIGNSPPTLGGVILQRIDDNLPVPYVIAIFQAGSVCFQIALRSEEKDRHVPNSVKLGISWVSNLAKSKGGYHSIKYCDPIQFDWSELNMQLQPFESFELKFNTETTQSELKPIPRKLDN